MKVKRIMSKDDLLAIAAKLRVRPDWHEPDEQEVTVSICGTTFDNAGFWGDAFPMTGAREKYVKIKQHGKVVAEVNLADLFAYACQGTV